MQRPDETWHRLLSPAKLCRVWAAHLHRMLTLITPYALPGTTCQQWRERIEQALQKHQKPMYSITWGTHAPRPQHKP